MPVVKVTEDGSQRTAEDSETDIVAVRVFQVEFDGTDDPANEPLLARNANDGTLAVPFMYQAHPYNSWMYVKKRSVRNQGARIWEVTVTYGTAGINSSGGQQIPQSPLDVPPEIEFGTVVSVEPIDRDINGVPITNSSDESYDPPITEEFHDLLIRIRMNTATFDAALAADAHGRVNAWQWCGHPMGTVRVNSWQGRQVFIPGGHYYEVQGDLQVRRDGWARRIRDEGFREKSINLETGQVEYTTCKDTEDVPLTQPVLLDGNGQKLAAGHAPVYKYFETKKQINFQLLGIG